MAPRKKTAAKPAAKPLDGCIIALSGTFSGHSQADIESDFIQELGATLTKSVTKATTHLVTSEADYKKGTTKVKQALENDIHLVKFEWLEDCVLHFARADEKDFAVDPSLAKSSGTATAVTATNGKAKAKAKSTTKRGANSDSEDDATAPPPKKAAAPKANGKSKAAKAPSADQQDLKKKIETKMKAEESENNITKSKDLVIQLDEGCTLQNHRVYIDDDGLIYDASLNQTNSGNNNNKFYRIQLLRNTSGDSRVWTRWGRVGDYGQSATLGSGSLADAIKQFEAKFKSKASLSWAQRSDPPKAGKYTFIERSYAEDSDDEADTTPKVKDEDEEEQEAPSSSLEPAVQSLMELIFNQQFFAATMSELNYDVNKLPLGKLSKTTILQGYQTLKDISELLNDNTLAQSKYGLSMAAARENLSNQFYSRIPHAFGRNRPPVIGTTDMLKKEVELLDSLSDMKEASNIMKKDSKTAEQINVLDQQFNGLMLDEMTPLDRSTNEFELLQEYLVNTVGHTHNHKYKVTDIFRIERQGEKQRFESAKHSAGKDTRLLWHGSRATNFGGILSQGLRIAPPEAPVNGYMFGKGVYLADMASKSANYCCASNSNGHALLLLCESELGTPMHTLTDASYSAGEDAKSKGALSTWGQGSHGPLKWKDASCVHPSLKGVKMPDTSTAPGQTKVAGAYLMYNEYIAYDISQIRLRYLLRVKM